MIMTVFFGGCDPNSVHFRHQHHQIDEIDDSEKDFRKVSKHLKTQSSAPCPSLLSTTSTRSCSESHSSKNALLLVSDLGKGLCLLQGEAARLRGIEVVFFRKK